VREGVSSMLGGGGLDCTSARRYKCSNEHLNICGCGIYSSMSKLFLYLLLGAVAGAALGYFGQCTSGTCPLTSNWKRGAVYGSVIALVMFFASGGFTKGSANQSTANVKKLSEAEFEVEVLRATGPVVVDFYAPWCGPCRTLGPMLDQVAGELQGRVRIVKVNVDETQTLARQYQIQSIPALKFFHKGKIVDEITGLPSKADLEVRLRKFSETASANL